MIVTPLRVAAILLLSPALLTGALESEVTCCFPNFMQGSMLSLRENQMTHFYVDYPGKFMTQTYAPYSPEANVTDFDAGITYVMTEDGCTTKTFTQGKLFQQCMRGKPEIYHIVNIDRDIHIGLYDQTDGDHHMRRGVTRRDGVCIPIIIYQEDSTSQQAHLFANVVPLLYRPDFVTERLKKCREQN